MVSYPYKGGLRMLKKILGDAPFEVNVERKVVLTPGEKTNVEFVFRNETEYDLPLCCSFNFYSNIKCDKKIFDITVPANGKTKETVGFYTQTSDRLFFGKNLCELKIRDGVLESESDYELLIFCEMSYSCKSERCDSDDVKEHCFFTRGGVFFANAGENVKVKIPTAEKKNVVIDTLSGKMLSVFVCGKECKAEKSTEIELCEGLNEVLINMKEDGNFAFSDFSGNTGLFLDTINAKICLEEKI